MPSAVSTLYGRPQLNHLNTTQKLPKKQQWTPRPSPFLAGLVSVQAASNDPGRPDITIYRIDVEDAEIWMRKAARRDESDAFFLRHDERIVEMYDAAGKLSKKLPKPEYPYTCPDATALQIDRSILLQQMRTALRQPQLSLLACAEDHAGASAADHSNFGMLCRRMIMESGKADLDQFYVGEHKMWTCGVSCIYADVSALSSSMQDIYLERHKWLKKSWPLSARHHFETLADRFARIRENYITDLLRDCGFAAGMSGEMILTLQSKWMLASPGVRYRFSQHLIDKLKDGLIYTPAEAEVFDPSYVEIHGAEAIRSYRTLLA